MGSRRLLKYALVSAAALAAAGALALAIFVDREASAPELKPRIEAAASDFLGRPVTIESIEWRRWPRAALVGRNVRLYEDPLKARVLVEAPGVEARLALVSIFKLAAGVTDLRFLSPRVSLRRDKDGLWNVERLVDEIAARPDEPGRNWGTLAFNWFTIVGGTVTVEDANGSLSALAPIDVDGSGKLRFGRRHVHFPFELSGRVEGSEAAIKLDGDLGRARLNVGVTNAETALAGLAWPPAARWSGRWDGSLRYDEAAAARWSLRVRAAPVVVSAAAPKIDSLEFTADSSTASSTAFTVAARSSTSEIRASGAAENRTLDVRVESAGADLAALSALARAVADAAPSSPAPEAPWRVNATVSADELRYGGSALRNVRAEATRRGDDRSPRWRLRFRAGPVFVSTTAPNVDSLELTADENAAAGTTFSGTARSSTTIVDAAGSLRKNLLTIEVKSPRADLETLLALARAGAASAPASPAPSRAPWKLNASISADDARLGDTSLRRVRAVVRRSSGSYTLDRLTLQTLDGSLEANGSYRPSSGDDAVKLSWKASGIGIQDLVRSLGSTREAAGVADCEGTLETGVGPRFLPGMSGTVKVDVKKGWFGGMPVLLKVLSKLNLTTLFSKVEGRARARVPFDEARGAVKIVKGTVSADGPLMLQNKTLQMAFMGSFNLPAKTVNGRVVVNFLTVTDEVIGLIPGVRDILLGGEKGLIPIWLEVKGNVEDPDVSVLSARTIAAPVWNTVGHILRLPKTLFEKLRPPTKPDGSN
jgi:uncharacterized protein YhdP